MNSKIQLSKWCDYNKGHEHSCHLRLTSNMAEQLLNSIGNTPLVKLTKLVSPDDADVYIKLEYLNPTGSYKDRMLMPL